MINFIQFIITRAFLAIITLLAVSFIVFALMELVPANCAERYDRTLLLKILKLKKEDWGLIDLFLLDGAHGFLI